MASAIELDEGTIEIPEDFDDILPDVPLWEMEIEPIGIPYRLPGTEGEWEHLFNCETPPKAYAANYQNKGILVIVGEFDISPLTGFTDQCEDSDDGE